MFCSQAAIDGLAGPQPGREKAFQFSFSMNSDTPHPGPSRQPLDLPTGPQTTSDKTSGSEPSKNEQRSSQSDSNSRKHTEESAQMVEIPRKRRHSSKDFSWVRTENEGSSHGKKRHKTSVKKAEPKANGHQDGLAHCPEPQDTDPPPIRKSLVNFLQRKSEEIYRDTVQMQAQQHGSLLTPEQLSQLRQLSECLSAMVNTFYRMANQEGFAFPAEGWLVPGPMPAPQELSGKESQSPLVEGREKITDSANPIRQVLSQGHETPKQSHTLRQQRTTPSSCLHSLWHSPCLCEHVTGTSMRRRV